MKRRVAVIGLDGATWTVLDRLVAEGRMPTLAAMMKNGAHGPLMSVIPPVSAPAWLSIATGRNPGTTGVFDFSSKVPGTYDVKFTDSRAFHKNHPLWEVISRNGGRSIVINYPILFPPYPTNGLIVSGIPCPEGKNITYPQSLIERLDKVTGGYQIALRYHDEKYEDRKLFFADLHALIDKRIKVISDLLSESWDLFFAVFSASDWLQHLTWGMEEHWEDVASVWSRLDEAISMVMERVGHDTNVIVMSDHGFGEQDGIFNLPRWLEQKGYMKIAGTSSKSQNLRRNPLYRAIKGIIPRSLRSRALAKVKSRPSIQIDYPNSLAYVCKHSIPFGGIYLNLQGREPQGIVSPNERSELKARITEDLHKVPCEIGRDIRIDVYDSEKLYGEEYSGNGPDLVVSFDGWSCVVKNNEYEETVYRTGPYSTRHVGSHRSEGILVASGPDISAIGTRVDGAEITDICPTVLGILGISTQEGTDGRVLAEMLREPVELAASSPKQLEQQRLRMKIRKMRKEGKI